MQNEKIQKYITKEVITINADEKFINITNLMVKNKVSCLIVMEDNNPIGIITERDILRTIISNREIDKIFSREIMSSPILSVKIDYTLPQIIKFMEEKSIRRALVVDNSNTMCGIITQTDLLQASASELIEYNLHLEKLVDSRTKKLKQLILTDELTRLFNRRYFNMRLTEHFNLAVRYNQDLSCIMTDIDFFKKVNDAYGHLCGDKILISFANILKGSLRRTDVCCRWGGEEFIMLLPFTKLEMAVMVTERLRKKIEENIFKFEKNNIRITASFGISSLEQKIKDENELVNIADSGLYKAKQEGRNKVMIGAKQ